MYITEIGLCLVLMIVVFALIYRFGIMPTTSPYGHHTGVYEVDTFILKGNVGLTLARFDESVPLTITLSSMRIRSLELATLDQVLRRHSEHRASLTPNSRIICRDIGGENSFWIVDIGDNLQESPKLTLCSYPDNEKGCLLALVNAVPEQAEVVQSV